MIPLGLQPDTICIMEPMTSNADTAYRVVRIGISSTSANDYFHDIQLILRSSGATEYSLVSLPAPRPVTLREIADLQGLDYDESESDPNTGAITRACGFASKAITRGLPNPTVLPLPEGGVMLRYRSGRLFVSVESFNDGAFIVAYSGAAVPTRISRPANDEEALIAVIAYLG